MAVARHRHALRGEAPASALQRHHQRGSGEDQVCGPENDLQAASSAVHDDLIERRRARVEEGAQGLSLSERTDSPDHVSGRALRPLRLRKLRLLGTCCRSNRLEVQAGVGRDDRTACAA